MEASILIVSKNRRVDLEKTLILLKSMLDLSKHEVLVFLDGCTDGSKTLKTQLPWVRWFESEESLGASPARADLYKRAEGEYLIGFDDDAHPLQADFIQRTLNVFNENLNVGIIAFEEIKGVYASDVEALSYGSSTLLQYKTNEFIGSGFAIRKSVYNQTNGFPVWMNIYGEEACVSIEVLALGYDILFTNQIKVNHRVDNEARKTSGKNYFRFERQLQNSTKYYLVYYKQPWIKIAKLYWHNFIKYALTDQKCFRLFLKAFKNSIFTISETMKYRKPIDASVIRYMRGLPPIKY